MTSEKIIYFGRHGKKDSNKEVTDDSVSRLYSNGFNELSDFVNKNGIIVPKSVIGHSDASRTQQTGTAVAMGAFGYEKPENLKELKDRSKNFNSKYKQFDNLSYNFSGNHPDVNMDLVKKIGEEEYIDFLMKNPGERTFEHNGEKYNVSSWKDIMKKGEKAVKDLVKQTKKAENDLAIGVTHSLLAEPMALYLANTGRESNYKAKMERPEDIGGWFNTEDYGIVNLSQNGKGSMKLGDNNYKINLSNI